jgi:hypothetical protein
MHPALVGEAAETALTNCASRLFGKTMEEEEYQGSPCPKEQLKIRERWLAEA